MAEEHVNVNISATDNLSKPARTAAKSLDDLGDKSSKAAVKVEALEQQLEDARNAAITAANRINALERQIKQMGNESLKSAAKIKALDATLNRMQRSGGVFGGMFGNGRRGGAAGGLAIAMKFSRFFKLILIPTIFDAVGAIATLGSALAAMGSAAIGGLGPLTGLLAAYPGYLAAIGQGYGVVALGMEKVKNVLSQLERPFKQLKDDVGNALLPGFRKLTETIRGYIPLLKTALTGTAKVISGTVSRISGFLNQSGTQASIGKVMKTNTGIVREFGKAAVPALRILLNVLNAAGPMLTKFARAFSNFTRNLADSSDNRRGLSKFFESTYRVTRQTIRVIADLSKGLYNVFKLGADLGGDMGRVIRRMARDFREWTETKEGRDSIRNWFKEMKPIIWEVGRLFSAIAKALGSVTMDKTLVTTLQTLRNDTVPALTQMLQAASGQFLPSIAKIIGTIAQIMTDLKIGPVILQGIATGLAYIAEFISGLPGPIKTALGYMVTFVALFKVTGFVAFFGFLNGMWAKLIGLLVGVKTAFGNVVFAMQAVRGGAATAGEAVGMLTTNTRNAGKAMLSSFGVGGALTVIAAMGMAMFIGNQRLKEMEENTKRVGDAFRDNITPETTQGLRDSLSKLQSDLESYQNKGTIAKIFDTNTWADVFGIMSSNSGIWNNNIGEFESSTDRMQTAIEQLQQKQLDYVTAISGASRETGRKGFEFWDKLAQEAGIDLKNGVAAASHELVQFYNLNYKSAPAVRDLANSLNTLSDNTAKSADKLSAFDTAMDSLQTIWTNSGKRGALVNAARGMKSVEDAMAGASVTVRNGNVTFKAALENNWALNDALTQQAEAIKDVASETYKKTHSIDKATKAYHNQYDALLDQLTALTGNRKAAKDLARQYMLTPKEITTAFKVPGFKEWLAEAPRSYAEVRRWIQNHPITPVIKEPKFEKNDKKWRRKSQKRANAAWAGRYAAQAGKSTTSTQTTMFQTPGLNEALTGFQSVKEYTQWINQNPATPQVDTTQLDTALVVAKQVRDVMQDISDLDFGGSNNKKKNRQFGGPVLAGTQYIVGEAGAEAFVGKNGAFQLIGTRGQEHRTFHQDGFVIPNHMLPEGELVGAVPVQASVHIGTINATSDIDVIRAVKQGIREAERNARERR